jgi:hypothetical protein
LLSGYLDSGLAVWLAVLLLPGWPACFLALLDFLAVWLSFVVGFLAGCAGLFVLLGSIGLVGWAWLLAGLAGWIAALLLGLAGWLIVWAI